MPKKVTYIGTVTFDGSHLPEKKFSMIKGFPKFIAGHLLESKEHELEYTIEYHKVGNIDDYEAPHIHYILYTTKPICKYRYRAILKALNEIYGRSQLMVATDMKLRQYASYIYKDVLKNEELHRRPHAFRHKVVKDSNFFDHMGAPKFEDPPDVNDDLGEELILDKWDTETPVYNSNTWINESDL